MQYNYHTHTKRCHHASGSDEAYVKAAIENGYDVLGFADHCAWRFENPKFKSGMRMREDEIYDYVSNIRFLQEKYKDKIKILLGYEVEYLEKYWPWMCETLEKFKFDYIILGHHFSGDEDGGTYNGGLKTPEQIRQYGDDVCKAMETNMLSYVAHPDLFMMGYINFDDVAKEVSLKIIRKSIETGVPIEYNLLGLSHSANLGRTAYPHPEFWKLAGQEGATALIGVDAHDPKHLAKTKLRLESMELLENLGVKLTENISLLNHC